MSQRLSLLTVVFMATLVTPTTAGPDKVAFPSGYKNHVLYATVDRPDNKTVRDLYASPEAARGATPGQPLPDGTVLTMEVYKAKVDDRGEPVKDAGWRLVRTPELVGIFVMEKRHGWGTEYPDTFRNGEWEYARFTAAGQPAPNFNAKPCFECHKPMSQQDFVFSFPKLTSRLAQAGVALGPRDGAGLPAIDLARVAVGSPAPDFTLESKDGIAVTLSSFRGRKNVVLVFYRGHW